MNLYVIRHAEAIDLGVDGVEVDEDRYLTEKGRQQAVALAGALARRGVQLDVVLTSPLVRARQTAEGMLAAWPTPHPQLRVCDLLAPGLKRKKLANYLEELGAARVALVGHMPDLAELTAWLMGSGRAELDYEKAGAALLTGGGAPGKGSCTLRWLVTPDWF